MPLALSLLSTFSGIALAPLFPGVVNRTKAFFAGRTGPPLGQRYRDVAKLLGKGAAYSRTTSWVFRAGPLTALAALVGAAVLVPSLGGRSVLAFSGDLILFVYLLALARFMTVLAALDTGSSFEGMGASREVLYAALAEPTLLIGLAAVARATGSLSLSDMLAPASGTVWTAAGPALGLVVAALLVVFLAENARIPFDDPSTHLELTMVHEAMVLDHGGPDLAFIEIASAIKLWILGSLLVGILVPVHSGKIGLDAGAFLAGMGLLAVLTGIVESSVARLRLSAVPQLLLAGGALSTLGLILVVW
jgi:formate hydrogenlyase subunit 4